MSTVRAARLICLLGPSLAVAGLCGCGRTVDAGPGRTLRLALNEYRLNPTSAHAGAGQLTVVLTNFGRLTHDLVITDGTRPVARLKPLAPGASEQSTVALVPGKYQLASTLSSDQALGILGTLTVS